MENDKIAAAPFGTAGSAGGSPPPLGPGGVRGSRALATSVGLLYNTPHYRLRVG